MQLYQDTLRTKKLENTWGSYRHTHIHTKYTHKVLTQNQTHTRTHTYM